MNPFVIWEGAASDPSGYGEATRNYIFGLDRLGVDVHLKNRRFWMGDSVKFGDRYSKIAEMASRPFPADYAKTVLLMNLTPENYHVATDAAANVCMTTFETDSLPSKWIMPIRAMDYVITFSHFNEETFENSGINRPIYVVPHGVDTDMYSPEVRPIESIARATMGKYVFGSNFDWTNRKNPTALLKAYFKAFEGNKSVAMVLKVYHQFPLERSVQTIKRRIEDIKAECKVANPPQVILISDMLSSDDMPKFYASINCFVLPTRGEGWGLPLSEAMSTGLPTIATDWGGQTEFMHKDNSYLIQSKLVDIEHKEVMHQPLYAGHRWAEVNLDMLIDTMRYVHRNATEAAKVGGKARRDMVTQFTWNHACEKLRNVLEAITE